MSQDRFITWPATPPEGGPPTKDRLMQVARDFLGVGWRVTCQDEWITCAEAGSAQTQPLASEHVPGVDGEPTAAESEGWRREAASHNRWFEVFFLGPNGEEQTSVITRMADPYTRALADEYARIVARWWGGRIEGQGADLPLVTAQRNRAWAALSAIHDRRLHWVEAIGYRAALRGEPLPSEVAHSERAQAGYGWGRQVVEVLREARESPDPAIPGGEGEVGRGEALVGRSGETT